MMAGKPIICAISGAKSLVPDYECGFQLASDDIDGALEAIDKLNKMNEEERIMMGRRGRDAVISHFTYRRLAEDFISNIE